MSRGGERKDPFYNDGAEKEECQLLESLPTNKRTSRRSRAGDGVGQKNLIREQSHDSNQKESTLTQRVAVVLMEAKEAGLVDVQVAGTCLSEVGRSVNCRKLQLIHSNV